MRHPIDPTPARVAAARSSCQSEQVVDIARDTGGSGVRRWRLGAAVVGLVLALAGQAGALGSQSDARKGGIFRISYAIGSGIDSLDPALAYTAPAWALLDTTCLRLMSYPDKPAPQSFRLVPEAATGPPRGSPTARRTRSRCERASGSATGSPCVRARSPGPSTERWPRR